MTSSQSNSLEFLTPPQILLPPYCDAMTALMNLDLENICLSSGAACHSGKVAPSETLMALHYSPEEALRALRISYGWDTQEKELLFFVTQLAKILERLKKDLS